ncbi:hypothetical protein E2C01_087922 [Portunus trituberculatus]|uniref:Uncharacterized protein n=1 Tax=Portunus trituberculatus TaxID=210409 RepID=A0A5B7JEM3_PORTR|nr:hypothetical protein [Portunus trituberculatus]
MDISSSTAVARPRTLAAALCNKRHARGRYMPDHIPQPHVATPLIPYIPSPQHFTTFTAVSFLV